MLVRGNALLILKMVYSEFGYYQRLEANTAIRLKNGLDPTKHLIEFLDNQMIIKVNRLNFYSY